MKKVLLTFLIVYTLFLALGLTSCSSSECTHENADWKVTKKATFLLEGERQLVCPDCEQILKTSPLPQLLCPHASQEWLIATTPTYDSEGTRELICLDCEQCFETEIIPILICDHEKAKWIEDSSRKFECPACDRTLLEYPLPTSSGLSADQVKELLSDSVFKVYCYGYDGKTVISKGSGFFIDTDGTFITNSHVVRDAYFVKICTASGEFYDVNIMYTYKNSGSDHAICKAENCTSVPVSFAPSYAVGDTVYAIGYPGDQTLPVVTEGEIIAQEKTVGKITYVPNSAPIVVGNSGGLLANECGEVIGITTGYTSTEEYLALHFDEFCADLFSKREEKTLFSYFHTKRTIELCYDNFDDIFELVDSDGYARVKVKDRLSKEKIATPDKITVFVTLADGTTTELVFETEAEIKDGLVVDVAFSDAKISSAEGTVIFYNTYLEI